MPDVSNYFQIRRIVAPASPDGNTFGGVAVVTSMDCSRVVIENTDAAIDINVRSNPADGGTQKTLPKGLELDINVRANSGVPFPAGTVVCWLAGVSGAPVACVTFTR